MTIILDKAADDTVALIDVQGAEATYGQLRDQARDLTHASKGLAFLRAENTVAAVSAYVACVEAGVPVLLLDKDVHEDALARLVSTYRPDLLLNLDPREGYDVWSDAPFAVSATVREGAPSTHPDLAVLLSTSGSTGTPKLVRLSEQNIVSNAESIANGLGIEHEHRPISSLPYSYTYGLSVINSHLRRGATVILTDHALTTREFWGAVDEHRVTSIAGVPSSYKMLRQMRWTPAAHSSLRFATQAGGRLNDDDRAHFLHLFDQAGAKFFVMYGQTEATARMTIAQPEDLREHISTAGRAVDGGRFEVALVDESGSGEVIYHGPNVMLGYAESAEDLALGDEMGGELHTGDLGYVEGDLLFLTGRTKRIVKVFGKRVSLDDIERWLVGRADAVAVQGDDSVIIVAVGGEDVDPQVRLDLAEYLGVHPSGIKLSAVAELPLLSSGKVDLQTLRESVS